MERLRGEDDVERTSRERQPLGDTTHDRHLEPGRELAEHVGGPVERHDVVPGLEQRLGHLACPRAELEDADAFVADQPPHGTGEE